MKYLIVGLMKHYGPDHMDYKDCAMAQAKLAPIVENVLTALKVTVSSFFNRQFVTACV